MQEQTGQQEKVSASSKDKRDKPIENNNPPVDPNNDPVPGGRPPYGGPEGGDNKDEAERH
jgi:hypothetical protein